MAHVFELVRDGAAVPIQWVWHGGWHALAAGVVAGLATIPMLRSTASSVDGRAST